MKCGDKVVFNDKARPRYLRGNIATVVLASESAAVFRVPLEGFRGDLRRFWTPGANFLAPLNILDVKEDHNV